MINKRWMEIKVGDIVRVEENQYFPCDLLLITSSVSKGVCYVETKNLDGETNLKHKKAPSQFWNLAKGEVEIMKNFNETLIDCELPNESIYKF